MKLNFKNQMIVSVVVILAFNILSTIFKHWIYRSIGFGICGLLYLIHPVIPQSRAASKQTLMEVRFAGIVLILIGIFTRSYAY